MNLVRAASSKSYKEMATGLTVVWHWCTMGPYHFARMRALQGRSGIRLTIAETSSVDDHEWIRGDEALGLKTVSLKWNGSARDYSALWELRPRVVVAPGYRDPHFLAALARYRKERSDCVAVLWSESTEIDHKRWALMEAVKTFCVSVFDGAIVAGARHAAYLTQLGMPADRIALVGNCVDNDFFSSRVLEIREHGEPVPNYFLFVGRLIPEKNVSGLIEAYDRYRRRVDKDAWPLVLVGGGQLEARLKQDVLRRGIEGIKFAGLRQVDELPRYYARAGCFVLPSTSEPWGLVVNEAMACGLPVLVSNRCGCSSELVKDGVNGFTFDPHDADHLASLMERVSNGDVPLERYGEQSARIISGFTLEMFAEKTESHFRALLARRRLAPHSLKNMIMQTAAAVWCKLN